MTASKQCAIITQSAPQLFRNPRLSRKIREDLDMNNLADMNDEDASVIASLTLPSKNSIEIEAVNNNNIVTDTIENESEEDQIERDKLLETLKSCYAPSIVETFILNVSNWPLPELRKTVETTLLNTGGSFDAAKKIREIEDLFVGIANSPTFQAKLAALEERGADYIKIVQRLERLAGSDMVVQSLKFDDFTALVKSLIRSIEMVHSSIIQIAEQENLVLPASDAFDKTLMPVVQGMPADPRIIAFIVTSLHSRLKGFQSVAAHSVSIIRDKDLRINHLEDEVKKLRDDLKSAIESKKGLGPIRKPVNIDYVIRCNSTDTFIRRLDEDAKLTFKNIAFDGEHYEALSFETVEKARRFIDLIKSKKPKTYKKLDLEITTIEVF